MQQTRDFCNPKLNFIPVISTGWKKIKNYMVEKQ